MTHSILFIRKISIYSKEKEGRRERERKRERERGAEGEGEEGRERERERNYKKILYNYIIIKVSIWHNQYTFP